MVSTDLCPFCQFLWQKNCSGFLNKVKKNCRTANLIQFPIWSQFGKIFPTISSPSTRSLSIDRAWYKLLYSDGDERQNMWTFIMSVVRFVFVFVNIWTRDKTFIMSAVWFARSNTSPIKHSLNNAMIRLLIFPNQKEEKIGGRRRGAVWGGDICK